MTINRDINNLPSSVVENTTNHLNHHSTIHAALKNHVVRLNNNEQNALSANTRATSAETKVNTYTPRVEALEALGGLSPESPVDGQTASLISQPGTLTNAATRDAVAHLSHQGVMPLQDAVIHNTDTLPLGVVEGVLYGASGLTLRKSNDAGYTWTNVRSFTGVSSLVRIIAAGDGEVLLVTHNTILRSTGWQTNPATATFTTTQTVTYGSRHTRFTVSVDEASGRVLTTEYGATNYAASQYVRLSKDYGRTWSIVYDIADHSSEPDLTHLHLAAIDPWENGRLYIAWHNRVAAHPERGVFYSDDDGTTWNRLPNTWGVTQPTVGFPTKYGMVWGTDENYGGVFVTPRGRPLTYERLWEWRGDTAQILGFAQDAWQDPDTGVVYMVFVAYTYGKPTVVATDGITASQIWEAEDYASHNVRGVESVTGIDGRLLMEFSHGDPIVRSLITASIPSIGVPDRLGWDHGRISGGRVSSLEGVSVGSGSSVGGLRGTALGNLSIADGTWSVAVGHRSKADLSGASAFGSESNASGSASTSLGQSSKANNLAVSVGAESGAYVDSVSVGYRADSRARDVAIGRSAKANGGYSSTVGSGGVAVGYQAEAANQSTVIGSTASSTYGNVVLVGYETTAGGSSSVAVGHKAEANLSDTTAVGANAIAEGSASVAVGRRAESNNTAVSIGSEAKTYIDSVSIGYRADARARDVALGRSAVANGGSTSSLGSNGVAVGYQANALNNATAIGSGSIASHDNSVAIGYNTTSTVAWQVAIGPRHIEATPPVNTPSAPTDGVRVYTRVVEGKVQLVARFPTGDPVVISQEA